MGKSGSPVPVSSAVSSFKAGGKGGVEVAGGSEVEGRGAGVGVGVDVTLFGTGSASHTWAGLERNASTPIFADCRIHPTLKFEAP